MNALSTDTIAAIATAVGPGGIAIVRLSGPECVSMAGRCFRGGGSAIEDCAAGTFMHGRVYGADGQEADEVIALVYRAPHSYTGEDVVEFQGHGGRLPAQRVLRAVLEAGARPAEPGEFTRRAFLNGRLDLVQAEAVADLIHARSDRAATAALEQLDGALSSDVQTLYQQVLTIAADLEATLDFDDDELPPVAFEALHERLVASGALLDRLLASWEEGHLLRDGARVVITGQPNVGKSTLLNALLGTDRAIVTSIPGTTRDVIEEQAVIDGLPLRLIDTAGLRETECEIEREGITRTHKTLARADLVLLVVDGSKAPTPEERRALEDLRPRRGILVLNKGDRGVHADWAVLTAPAPRAADPRESPGPAGRPPGSVRSDRSDRSVRSDRSTAATGPHAGSVVSPAETTRTTQPTATQGVTGSRAVHCALTEDLGLAELKRAIGEALGLADSGTPHAVISERHRHLLRLARHECREAERLLAEGREDVVVLAASTLRTGLEQIGTITGRVYSDELLDTIFTRFCIGK